MQPLPLPSRRCLVGEIAEMMLSGQMCQRCGEYLGDGDGYPVSCCEGSDQHRRMTPAKRARRKRNKNRRAQKRRDALAAADLNGWTQLSPHHFRKVVGANRVEWWPSTGKYCLNGKMVEPAKAQEALNARN